MHYSAESPDLGGRGQVLTGLGLRRGGRRGYKRRRFGSRSQREERGCWRDGIREDGSGLLHLPLLTQLQQIEGNTFQLAILPQGSLVVRLPT